MRTTVHSCSNIITGPIPQNIGTLTSLQELNLNSYQLVGLIPVSLAHMELEILVLNNNMLMCPIPEFKAANVSYDNNLFCPPEPGLQCSPQVAVLLDFLDKLNYPSFLISDWVGDEPCTRSTGLWFGLSCNSNSELDSLLEIRLVGNNITGSVPNNFTDLKSLRLLDLSDKNLEPPLPKFHNDLKFVTVDNLLLPYQIRGSPSLMPINSSPSPQNPSHPPSSHESPVPDQSSRSNQSKPNDLKIFKTVGIVAGVAVFAVVALLVVYPFLCWRKNKKASLDAPSSIMVHPRDPSFSDNMVKIAVSNATVTNDFASENELGYGGFGTVYKGELGDGTKIVVKRMEHGAINSKALEEFQAEIAVLSKVRHRHLVALLGYSIEGNERLLVYEYMSLGALSQHLFHWKSLKLEPLSWSQRLAIALDVARGIEYLHSLAHFGLVKHAPDSEKSVATKLLGHLDTLPLNMQFPCVSVMGKITTKVVFSYGVVLMELLTGLVRVGQRKAGIVAELAGHCTAREAHHRPDMGHAVNVLAALVEKWKPVDDELDCYSGIDYTRPLPQMLKIWKEAESEEFSYAYSLANSRSSIAARSSGFADSFTSADAR
ncbi:Receptor-like kinase TMK3 [Glycine max]|nr:Receptor-like kinase TMK3 [Glycine max]